MNRFRNWLSRVMYGRYGVDQLGRVLLYVEIGLLFVAAFVPNPVLSIVTSLLLVWIFFRMMSRNISRRAEENRRFLSGWNRVKSFFTGGMRAAKDRDHAYFRCPSCGQRSGCLRARAIFRLHVRGATHSLSRTPDERVTERFFICLDISRLTGRS